MSENETAAPVPLAALYAALAKAQGEFLPIERSRTVTVQPKQKEGRDGKMYWPKEYTFDYAPLEEVLAKCTPALSANGLTLLHKLDLENGKMVTVLGHESGAEIAMGCPIPKADWQQLGSAITYARRYTVQCVLGVAAEYDDDGNSADGNDIQPQAKQPPRSQPTPPAPKPQARKPEPHKAPPVDPQMQADIDRRKRQNDETEAQSTAAIRKHEGEPVSAALEVAREALAQTEQALGIAPAVVNEKTPSRYPAAPGPAELPDSHVHDSVELPPGSATRKALRAQLDAAGFSGEEKTEFVIKHSGVDPRTTPLTYGNARVVMAALAAQ